MNPTTVVAIVALISSIIGAVALVLVARINARSNEAMLSMKNEVVATKDEIVAVGHHFDGHMDALLKKIDEDGYRRGKKEQAAIITEEATRVAGIKIEAEKRAERAG